MTDPASVLKCEVDNLIQQQIATLKQPRPLTPLELADHHTRSQKILALFREIDRKKRVLDGEHNSIYPHSSA
jgi:hypothetical protein